MTIREAIDTADRLKPNQSDNEQVPIVQKQADPFHDVE